MRTVFETATRWLVHETGNQPVDDFVVRVAFQMEMWARPTAVDPIWTDHLLLLSAGGPGYVTLPGPLTSDRLRDLIGMDVRDVTSPQDPVSWACIDAALSMSGPAPASALDLSGTSNDKALQRAVRICEEVRELAHPGARVLVVGAVGTVIGALSDAGFDVVACDMDASLQGKNVGSCEIPRGGPEVALSLAGTADVLLATAMTLVNGTFDELLNASGSKPRLLYSQSCPSIASRLVDAQLIDTAIVERWPNYFFPAATKLEIFRGARHA